MLFDFVLGVLGPLLGLFALKFLGDSKVNRKQQILLFTLSGLTFLFYIIFGVFDYGLEEGPAINLGLFQISYGISEVLLILLILLLPLVIGVVFAFSLKNFKWLKRFIMPLLLALAVGSINFFQTYREVRQHRWDFETPYYNNNCLPSYEPQYCYSPD